MTPILSKFLKHEDGLNPELLNQAHKRQNRYGCRIKESEARNETKDVLSKVKK